MKVVVVATGAANTASVLAGLRRAGGEPELGRDPEQVADAERVVLPGVGAFGAAMAVLHEVGLVSVLRERVEAGRATLGICLGLQLLAESSDEAPGVAGLGLVPGRVTRFPDGVVIPQMGWNRVHADPGCRLLAHGTAWFANSYRLSRAPTGWGAARAVHGEPFVAAIERGSVLACQFHPELSGDWGRELLRRWLEAAC